MELKNSQSIVFNIFNILQGVVLCFNWNCDVHQCFTHCTIQSHCLC